jgi:hypothetical protein
VEVRLEHNLTLICIPLFNLFHLMNCVYFNLPSYSRSLESAIPLLLRQLEAVSDYSIAFPDDGAFKRFHTMFDEKLVIVCNKVRDGAQRHVRVKEGSVYTQFVCPIIFVQFIYHCVITDALPFSET